MSNRQVFKPNVSKTELPIIPTPFLPCLSISVNDNCAFPIPQAQTCHCEPLPSHTRAQPVGRSLTYLQNTSRALRLVKPPRAHGNQASNAPHLRDCHSPSPASVIPSPPSSRLFSTSGQCDSVLKSQGPARRGSAVSERCPVK